MHVEPAEQPAGALDQTEIFICEDGSSHDGASPKAARADRQRPRIVDCRRMTDAFIGYSTHRLYATRHANRSEEHTSELQSLMRISYAVFCLKKKNINYQDILHTTK